ncbi:MAG TPA: UbiX family flavin prenyltransferase [Chromatiales bacterium]|nr:UbiX family flavin prenyltransferase [Thiotrichales bacterium]HIP67003.1 UbiX family flavin prenyltransferase [Chromatiales bacterium]
MTSKHITLAMTGASGAQYGLRLLELLLQADCRVSVLMSQPGQIVIGMETNLKLPGRSKEIERALIERYQAKPGQLHVYGQQHWTAPVASGSGVADAMVICPCTTGTLSAVATGQSRSLLERAADVTLKERKPLIMVVRETPVSSIHLQNMLTLSQAGAVIMPASPGFYQQPETVDDLIDFMVARVLDQLAIKHKLIPAWGEATQ